MQLRYTLGVSQSHGHNSCNINGHVHIKYLSLQRWQFLDLLDDSGSLQVYRSVIDRICAGLRFGLLQGDLPDVVGLLIRKRLDQLWALRVFFYRAYVLTYTPAAVPDVAGSGGADCVILDFIGEFAVVGVVLHRGDEGELVEEGSPVGQSLVNHQPVVGAFIGIGAGGIDGIVVVGEAGKMRVF